MSSYKTIQVTKREYELLMELKSLLLRQGTNSIEETIDTEFSIDQTMEDMNRNSLAKGAVAGIAIALTLHLLRQDKEKERKRKGKARADDGVS